MERNDKRTGESRRGFLKLASLGSVAAGAAALISGEAEASTETYVSSPDNKSTGYRETELVRKAYAAARF